MIIDVFENLMKGIGSFFRKIYIYIKIFCNFKWLLINFRLLIRVLGIKGYRKRSIKELYEEDFGSVRRRFFFIC